MNALKKINLPIKLLVEYIENNYAYEELSGEDIIETYPLYFKGLESTINLIGKGDYIGISNRYDLPLIISELLDTFKIGVNKINDLLYIVISEDKEDINEDNIIREILYKIR